ncbi:MAG TPA: transporter, partial [Rhodobacteraceae bacterium]|nr:transporter [Paracoccaceae bacterium]
IFAMVAIGYALVARGMFRPEEMKTFGTYVMNLALPALVFHTVASRPVSEVFNIGYMSVYLAGALITIGLGLLWFTATQSPSRRGVAIMGTTCPNSGFIGYPLMLVLFPDQAGLILALNMLVENVVIIPTALLIMELGEPKGQGRVLPQLARVFLGVVKRPLVIGMALGLLVSLSGLVLPEPLERLVTLVSASAAALALVVIGGSLVGLPMKGNRGLAGQIVAGKLLVMPAATVLVLLALGTYGVTLPPDLKTA